MKTQETFVASLGSKAYATPSGLKGSLLVTGGDSYHVDTMDTENVAERVNRGEPINTDKLPPVSNNEAADYYAKTAKLVQAFATDPTHLNAETNNQLAKMAAQATGDMSIWRNQIGGPKGIEVASTPFEAIGVTDGDADNERGRRGKYRVGCQVDFVPSYGNPKQGEIMRTINKSGKYNVKTAAENRHKFDEMFGEALSNVGQYNLYANMNTEGVMNNNGDVVLTSDAKTPEVAEEVESYRRRKTEGKY